MKLHEKNEDAASPVIGVMLMLVVTVVIAAVVVAFATGMAGDSTATTPMALLNADNLQLGTDVEDGKTYLNSFDIVHKGGDELALENIQIKIEPGSGSGASQGIILMRTGADLTVSSGDKTVSTGDRIKVPVNTDKNVATKGDDNINPGGLVKWTVSDVRTTGVIAKGEFVVPEA